MVTILPPKTDLGTQLGQSLRQGFQSGFGQFMQEQQMQRQLQQQMLMKQAQEAQQRSNLSNVLSQANQIWESPGSTEQKILGIYSLLPNDPATAKSLVGNLMSAQKQSQGQELFNKLFPESIQQFGQGQQPSIEALSTSQANVNDPKTWSDQQINMARSFAGQPGDAGIIGTMADNEFKRREEEQKNRKGKEKEYFKINEPLLVKNAETLKNLKLENARYERLGQLFENPENFPSPFTAALFSTEGQLNDIAYSQLTEEAQEAIKLIIDSTSNIKDTYGARVTNFDLQTYLKKLPSLLNSPEGKKRVLRDLQLINQINRMHSEGINEIFDEAGGSDQIPFSTAERRFQKKYGPQIDKLLEQFVTPKKGKFKERPNAQQYLGNKIRDDETGEVFISDGNEWKPFKG